MSEGKPSRRFLVAAIILASAALLATCIGYVARKGGRCPVCSGDGVIEVLRR